MMNDCDGCIVLNEKLISFYEHTLYGDVCCGDLDVTDNEIYEVNNPYFLSDVFVFCKKHLNIFLVGEVDVVCFIKVNSHHQIEEMGTDFVSRFHDENIENIMKRKDTKKADVTHRMLFSLISDEYWCKLYKD